MELQWYHCTCYSNIPDWHWRVMLNPLVAGLATQLAAIQARQKTSLSLRWQMMSDCYHTWHS